MNNLRLLTGLMCLVLSGVGACLYGQNERVCSIEELFELAESNSVRLRPYVTATLAAEEGIREARTGRLPEINANLSVSYIGDGFTTKRNFTDYQKAPIPHLGTGVGLKVEQPVYTGGAITAGIDLASLKSTATRFATDLERDNIRFQVAGNYLDLYKCINLRKVVESNLALARRELDQMRARYEQGVVLQNDITRYELLVSRLELELIRLDNTADILNREIVTVTGLPADTKVVPDTTLLTRSLNPGTEAWWQQEAEMNSPVLRLAVTEIEINRESRKLINSDRLPKVGLQAGWTLDGPILVEVPPINRNLSYWYVGVGVSYNLASLYKTNKSLATNSLRTLEAEQRLEAARERVNLDIRADHIRYQEACEEVRTQLKSLELAERNYSTVSTRYNADMALITDLTDAANARLEAGQLLVNARINILYYYYKLLFTSGQI